jgi:histidinol dehydrogenase
VRVDKNELAKLFTRMMDLGSYVDRVRPIIDEVRRNGDDALIRFTREFDGVELKGLEVSRDELGRLVGSVEPGVARAIDYAIESVEKLNARARPVDVMDEFMGLMRRIKWVPIDRVGIYVPKGYFSTLIMTGVLAKVAGVREIIVATPPTRDGTIAPEIAYVAVRLGARVFKVGGAHAIAAMAFGTATVPKVDKVVGPGNVYVQAAKILVSNHVGIDGIEGPTELAICAGPSVDPPIAAMDLAAQLEHASAIGVVLSWDEDYLARVETELAKLGELPYVSALVDDARDCVNVINELAPEHVSIWGADIPIDGIRNAGAISIMTPSALIDYIAGPSHVLPTNGSARWRGVLTPLDFMKPIATVEVINAAEVMKLGDLGYALGLREGFVRHAESIKTWLGRLG